MKLFFNILLFLSFFSHQALSNPNNIGLFCPYKEKYNTTTGYWFMGNYVEQYRVFDTQIKHYANKKITIKGTDTIYFFDEHNPGDFMVYVNRKTLIVGDVYKRKCELINSKQSMLDLMYEDMLKSSKGNKF